MKVLYLFLLLCFVHCVQPVGTLAQSQARADKHYNNFDYALALEEYKKLLDKEQPSLHVTERIAHCYRLINQPGSAQFWYRQALGFAGAAPINLLYYANACRQNGEYTTAKQHYLLFAEREPGRRAEALNLAKACDLAMSWIARPVGVDVIPDSTLNSPYADFSPVFYREGLVFSSDRVRGHNGSDQKVYGWTGTPYLQLYYAERKGTTAWAEIKPMEKTINTQFHNAIATFSPDFNEVFFTRTKRVKNRVLPDELLTESNWQRYSKNDEFINRLEIYSATFAKDKWQDAKAFPFNQSESYSVGHPALSPDGRILYFASDMPGGYGQTDLYFSERQQDGSWSTPVNAGPVINTAGKEVFPVVHADGTLYFSSDGHLGMGGLDLFSAEGSRATWSPVENLYYPFNSPRDDFGLIYEKDGKSGYLSSNREGDTGSDNIYRFKPTEVPCKLSGITYARVPSRTGRARLERVGQVRLEITMNGDTANALVLETDARGQFLFQVKANQTYTIRGSKRGYLTQTFHIMPDCRVATDTVHIEMVMDRDTPNQPIVLENLYYDLDKHNLRPEAIIELDKVVSMLRDNPTIKIELSSHTDSRETHRYNLMLSQLRAASAVKYILSQGIAPERVVDKGYGETRLLNRCKDGVPCSEEEHQLNRRTEFKIIR
ncbi:OmpA family protein [Rufibacter psychrotolerans]|uniref:OmpA family protein n=1 Tax=Rufibacter psychrotolerans TaxID=2812556 RepID=UPI00293D3595|nr:OmpA family protein [Rufibacter sp. SYSU D00308]